MCYIELVSRTCPRPREGSPLSTFKSEMNGANGSSKHPPKPEVTTPCMASVVGTRKTHTSKTRAQISLPPPPSPHPSEASCSNSADEYEVARQLLFDGKSTGSEHSVQTPSYDLGSTDVDDIFQSMHITPFEYDGIKLKVPANIAAVLDGNVLLTS